MKGKGPTPRTTPTRRRKPKTNVGRPARARGAGARRQPRATSSTAQGASQQIDRRIRELADGEESWRGRTLARMRALILEAAPGITEEWKWMCPVWSSDGIVCTGEAYKHVVKLTFARGASLPDPKRLFNSGLGGGTRRAIDIPEGETVDAAAFTQLSRRVPGGRVPPAAISAAASCSAVSATCWV